MAHPQPLRVGVLTFLHNDNYGSTLQAYALQRTLQEMGADVEHLDYTPSLTEKVCNLLRSGNSPRLLLDSFRRCAVKQGQAGAREKGAAFRTFYRDYMRLSAPCRTEAALAAQARQYDCLVAGSDQIWSPTWLNRVYFLSFAPAGVQKVAYAPSLGVNHITNHRKARKMAGWLKDFDHLSVREAQGAALLETMLGQRPPVMPDPVVLLPVPDWSLLAEQVFLHSPYLLCYFIGDAPIYWDTVKRIAGDRGLIPVVIPVTEGAYATEYTALSGISPQAWLGAIQGAAWVCTDSFHCALFAAMLGVPFTALMRDDPSSPASRNSRLDQLFQQFGITSGTVPDWAKVAEKHQQLAAKGRAFLQAAVLGQLVK